MILLKVKDPKIKLRGIVFNSNRPIHVTHPSESVYFRISLFKKKNVN